MIDWQSTGSIVTIKYVCGHCGTTVTSGSGYRDKNANFLIRICPCGLPTFFDPQGHQYPAYAFGNTVDGVPTGGVDELYGEARKCTSAAAYTSAVLTCRKLLMHIAVEKKAPIGKSFIEYVEYLSDNHYVPPDGKEWVDYIRTKGNEANHEIVLMDEEDAKDLIVFTEMLLKFVYEFPKKIKSKETEP